MSETTDIGKQQVAAVYAKALIGAAEKSGTTDEVVNELGSLVEDVLVKFPGFESTIGSPRPYVWHDRLSNEQVIVE